MPALLGQSTPACWERYAPIHSCFATYGQVLIVLTDLQRPHRASDTDGFQRHCPSAVSGCCGQNSLPPPPAGAYLPIWRTAKSKPPIKPYQRKDGTWARRLLGPPFQRRTLARSKRRRGLDRPQVGRVFPEDRVVLGAHRNEAAHDGHLLKLSNLVRKRRST